MDLDLKGRVVLVTGATGLVGSAVAARLVEAGGRVRALVRSPSRAASLARQAVELVQGDLTDPSSVGRAMEGCGVVFHFAAVMATEFGPWSHYRRVNVEGTRLLAEAAVAAGVDRFLHASTVSVYGLAAGPGTDERSQHRVSRDRYADTKLEAELVVRRLHAERGLPLVIVQPSEVYGPGDQAWTLTPLRLIQARRMFLPDGGRGLIQPVFVDDLAEGILAAARRGRNGEDYILCGARVVELREFFSHHLRLADGTRLRSVPGPLSLALATLAEWGATVSGIRPPFTRAAVRATLKRASFKGDKAERALGWVPKTSLEEGMVRVERWLRSHPEALLPIPAP